MDNCNIDSNNPCILPIVWKDNKSVYVCHDSRLRKSLSACLPRCLFSPCESFLLALDVFAQEILVAFSFPSFFKTINKRCVSILLPQCLKLDNQAFLESSQEIELTVLNWLYFCFLVFFTSPVVIQSTAAIFSSFLLNYFTPIHTPRCFHSFVFTCGWERNIPNTSNEMQSK